MKNYTNCFMIVTENASYNSETDSTYNKNFFLHFFYSLYFSGITSFTWSMFEINILPNVPESFFKHALVVLSTIIA